MHGDDPIGPDRGSPGEASPSHQNRRTFLKRGGGATAAATAFGFQVVPRHVVGGTGQTPPLWTTS